MREEGKKCWLIWMFKSQIYGKIWMEKKKLWEGSELSWASYSVDRAIGFFLFFSTIFSVEWTQFPIKNLTSTQFDIEHWFGVVFAAHCRLRLTGFNDHNAMMIRLEYVCGEKGNDSKFFWSSFSAWSRCCSSVVDAAENSVSFFQLIFSLFSLVFLSLSLAVR